MDARRHFARDFGDDGLDHLLHRLLATEHNIHISTRIKHGPRRLEIVAGLLHPFLHRRAWLRHSYIVPPSGIRVEEGLASNHRSASFCGLVARGSDLLIARLDTRPPPPPPPSPRPGRGGWARGAP